MLHILPNQHVRNIAGIVAALFVLAVVTNRPEMDQAQPKPSVESAPASMASFGPGGRVDVDEVAPLSGSAEKLPDYFGALSFSNEQRDLVVNIDLLKVLEFYFPAEQGLKRANELAGLRIFLADRLTAASVDRALRIAADYRSYLTQYDSLLAAQNFDRRSRALSTLDAGRIKTWMQLRRRLRQNVLGEEVTNAWYENDDAQLDHVLEELQQAENANSFDDANRRYMQNVLDCATTDFVVLQRRPSLPGQ